MKSKYNVIRARLIKTAWQLYIHDMPCCTVSDDFYPHTNGHWSEVKRIMEENLKRKLNPYEVTLLSFTRYFGPTPVLSNTRARKIFMRLFPEGNSCGHWYDWYGIAQELKKC